MVFWLSKVKSRISHLSYIASSYVAVRHKPNLFQSDQAECQGPRASCYIPCQPNRFFLLKELTIWIFREQLSEREFSYLHIRQ